MEIRFRTRMPDMRDLHRVICVGAVAMVCLLRRILATTACIVWRCVAGSLDVLQAVTQPETPYGTEVSRWDLCRICRVLGIAGAEFGSITQMAQ